MSVGSSCACAVYTVNRDFLEDRERKFKIIKIKTETKIKNRMYVCMSYLEEHFYEMARTHAYQNIVWQFSRDSDSTRTRMMTTTAAM